MEYMMLCRCHMLRTPNNSFPVLASQPLVASLLALISLSTSILASYSSHFLTWVSLAAVKPKEDGGQNEFDKIKDKDASRAGNERGYRIFFSSILIFLFSPNSPSSIWKGFKIPHTAIEKIKHKFSTPCSAYLTECKPNFSKSLTAIPCQKGYQSR